MCSPSAIKWRPAFLRDQKLEMPPARITFAQILIAVSVATSILLQARGTGLSSTFGGESTAYRSRRGIERTLFRLTIALIFVYVIISLVGARSSAL